MHAHNKYERILLGAQKILKAYKETRGRGRSGVYLDDWHEHGPRYRHFSYNDRWGKTYANRVVRHAEDIPQHGGYRKVFDYDCWCW